jgi:hypothetical protein
MCQTAERSPLFSGYHQRPLENRDLLVQILRTYTVNLPPRTEYLFGAHFKFDPKDQPLQGLREGQLLDLRISGPYISDPREPVR